MKVRFVNRETGEIKTLKDVDYFTIDDVGKNYILEICDKSIELTVHCESWELISVEPIE